MKAENLPSILPHLESVQKSDMVTSSVSCQIFVHPAQTTSISWYNERLRKCS